MQTAEANKGKGKKHDTDLLLKRHVGAFRQWLVDTMGFEVTDPDPGQVRKGVYYWVSVPAGKTPIPVSVQQGAPRNPSYVETHYRLRPYLERFLTKPMSSAIKDVVRPRQPNTLQAVVGNRLQSTPAANFHVVPEGVQLVHTPAPETKPETFLLSEDDLRLATQVSLPVRPDDEHQFVYCVRVGQHAEDKAGVGNTVAVLLKVYTREILQGVGMPSKRTVKCVEVIDIPFNTNSGNLGYMADALSDLAAVFTRTTILVDGRGMGRAFFDLLQERCGARVKRFAMAMGQTLPKAAGRYTNRRAQCFLDAARWIQGGCLRISRPIHSYGSFGSQIKLEIHEDDRVGVMSPKDTKDNGLPSPDVFEAICMVFADGLDFSDSFPVIEPVTTKPAPAATRTPKPAAALKLDKYLTELRDDFAASHPLVPRDGETTDAFAIRCWEYADSMIKNRPSDVRG